MPTIQENSPEGPEVGRLRKLEWAGSVVLHIFHGAGTFDEAFTGLICRLQGSHIGRKVVCLEVLDLLATPEELKFCSRLDLGTESNITNPLLLNQLNLGSFSAYIFKCLRIFSK